MKNILLSAFLLALTIPISSVAAEWYETTIGEYHTYLYTPDTEPKLGNKRALMVFLKECYQSAEAMKIRGGWKETADDYGMVVAIPGVNTQCFGFSPSPQYGADLAYEKVFEVVTELQDSNDLDIDPNKVYVSGFGAGGSVAMEMACRYPDTIAGVGIASAQSVGADQTNSYLSPSITSEEVAQYCLELAGDKSEFLSTQIASLVSGNNGEASDGRIYSSWTNISAEALALIYEVQFQEKVTQLSGVEKNATEMMAVDSFANDTISKIFIPDMDHYWSSGLGGGLSYSDYIDGNAINYPRYLTSFLLNNSLRYTEDLEVYNVEIKEQYASLLITGSIKSNIGEIISATLNMDGKNYGINLYQSENEKEKRFSKAIDGGELPAPGLYGATIKVQLKERGIKEIPIALDIPELGFIAPKITDIDIETQNDCILVSGSLYDYTEKLTGVEIGFAVRDRNKMWDFTVYNSEINILSRHNRKEVGFNIKKCGFEPNEYIVAVKTNNTDNGDSNGYVDYYFDINIDPIENFTPTIISYDIEETDDGSCITIRAEIEDDLDHITEVGLIAEYVANYPLEGIIKGDIAEQHGSLYLNGSGATGSNVIIDNESCQEYRYPVKISLYATDNFGNTIESPPQYLTYGIFEPNTPKNHNPTISYLDVGAHFNGCITVSGSAYDEDGVIDSLVVVIDDEEHPLHDVITQDFQFRKCGYMPGVHEVAVVAVDNLGDYIAERYSVEITDIGWAIDNFIPFFTKEVEVKFDDQKCLDITAEAIDSDGVIVAGFISIGDKTYNVDPVQTNSGAYSLQQKVCGFEANNTVGYITTIDNQGSSSSLEEGKFQIPQQQINIKPTITIKEPIFEEDCINISGTAADEDGSIDSVFVSFLANGAEISEYSGYANLKHLESSVYEYQYSLCDAGNNDYSVIAKATDNLQDTVSSNVIEFEYHNGVKDNVIPEFVSNINTLVVESCVTISGDAIDYDGEITQISIFLGTNQYEVNEITKDRNLYLFTKRICQLTDDYYSGYVQLIDNKSGMSAKNELSSFEFTIETAKEPDFDKDGIPDSIDPDDDNDGVADSEDAFQFDPTESSDFDGDRIGDNADTDDDNDGVADSEDAFQFDPTESSDFDGDRIGDNADTDDDNDGVADAEDAFQFDPTESSDFDGDKIGDNADMDDDNDGVADVEDAFQFDPNESSDFDGDGIGDNADTDDDNDGYLDDEDFFPKDPELHLDPQGIEKVGSDSSSGGGGSPAIALLLLLTITCIKMAKRDLRHKN